MTPEEIRQRLTRVFQKVLDPQIVFRADLKPGDLPEWDSVAHVTIIMAIEKEFKIKFKGAEIATVVSMGDMVKRIGEKVGVS